MAQLQRIQVDSENIFIAGMLTTDQMTSLMKSNWWCHLPCSA